MQKKGREKLISHGEGAGGKGMRSFPKKQNAEMSCIIYEPDLLLSYPNLEEIFLVDGEK